jgi:hypothetical protein
MGSGGEQFQDPAPAKRLISESTAPARRPSEKLGILMELFLKKQKETILS